MLLCALAWPAGAAASTLVEARAGAAASTIQRAGGVPVAPELRLWRVPDAALSRLRRAGVVAYAERDEPLRSTASPLPALGEPLAPEEWWRSVVGADSAAAPGPGRAVTIVDAGLDLTHPEFAARPNTRALNEQAIVVDDDDHGTEVASVIGAPVNGIGLAGIYPQAVLQSWDASPFAGLEVGSAVRGIVTAANSGAGVINLSFGGTSPDPLIENAVLYAFKHGSLVVASAGNDGLSGNELSYPASFPHVLTVGATDQEGLVAGFSSESSDVDLVAPGDHIPVAEPLQFDPSGYTDASGTSFSAPLVSGAAAWVWTVRPRLDNTQLFDLMRSSAHDLAPAGVDEATGYGVLDVPAALAAVAPPPDPLEPNDDIGQVAPHVLFASGGPPLTTAQRHGATLSARVDRHEDPHDVYRAFVPARGSLVATTSGGRVDLRLYGTSARSVSGRSLAIGARAGTEPDRVRFRNGTARGVYVYVEVRPEPGATRSSYTLRITSSARR